MRRTGESSSSAGLRPAGMEKKAEKGDPGGGGEMGRLGGCADLNLGTPPPRLNPLGERCSAAAPGPEPDRSSVKEVMNGGGVNVNAACAWSKLPVEDAMAVDRGRWGGVEREGGVM